MASLVLVTSVGGESREWRKLVSFLAYVPLSAIQVLVSPSTSAVALSTPTLSSISLPTIQARSNHPRGASSVSCSVPDCAKAKALGGSLMGSELCSKGQKVVFGHLPKRGRRTRGVIEMCLTFRWRSCQHGPRLRRGSDSGGAILRRRHHRHRRVGMAGSPCFSPISLALR